MSTQNRLGLNDNLLLLLSPKTLLCQLRYPLNVIQWWLIIFLYSEGNGCTPPNHEHIVINIAIRIAVCHYCCVVATISCIRDAPFVTHLILSWVMKTMAHGL